MISLYIVISLVLLCVFIPLFIVMNHNNNAGSVMAKTHIFKPNSTTTMSQTSEKMKQTIVEFREQVKNINSNGVDASVALIFTGTRIECMFRQFQNVITMIRHPVHVFVYGHVSTFGLPDYTVKSNSDTFQIVPTSESFHIEPMYPYGKCSIIGLMKNIMHGMDLVTAYQLKHGVTYDCVIRMRPDMVLNEVFHVPQTLNLNTVYYTTCNGKEQYWERERGVLVQGINDHMFFGTFHTMERFCQAYKYLGKLNENHLNGFAEGFLYLVSIHLGLHIQPFKLMTMMIRYVDDPVRDLALEEAQNALLDIE